MIAPCLRLAGKPPPKAEAKKTIVLEGSAIDESLYHKMPQRGKIFVENWNRQKGTRPRKKEFQGRNLLSDACQPQAGNWDGLKK